MPKKIQRKTKVKPEKKVLRKKTAKTIEQKNRFWEIFKFGESYTSLILGIVFVVIATVFLLTLVKGKNTSNPDLMRGKDSMQTQKENSKLKDLGEAQKTSITEENRISPTVSIAELQVSPEVTASPNNSISGDTYVTKPGDTLWNIAERKYQSGYNWIDIQKANNLTNPDMLYAGTNLKLPNVEPKTPSIAKKEKITPQISISVAPEKKITSSIYVVSKGDTLWSIAERSYGDGYAWTKIAAANNLSNPDLIFSGNSLSIPRK